MTKQSYKPKRRLNLPILTAAIVLILAGVAGAVNYRIREPLPEDMPVIEGYTLEEQLGQQWIEYGGILDKVQKQQIAQAIQTVNVSDRHDGVTVTLDAVYAAESKLFMILKIQGDELACVNSEDLHEYHISGKVFGQPETEIRFYSIGAKDEALLEDGTLLRCLIVDVAKKDQEGIERRAFTLLDGAELELRLKNLAVYGDAEWVLPISLAPAKNREVVTIEQASAGGYLDGNYDDRQEPEISITLRDIQISAAGYCFQAVSGWPADVFLCLADGQEVKSIGTEGGGSRDEPKEFTGCWPAPVDLSQAAALKIGETLIPLH